MAFRQPRSVSNANNPPPPPPLFSKLGKKDDLLVEILIRSFPDPKSACRCKLVCKRWSNLIAGPSFNRRFASHHQFLLARAIFHNIPSTINVNNNNNNQVDSSGDKKGNSKPWAELISLEPRVFVYHNFLSKKECDYLISQAKPRRMVRSKVYDSTTGLDKQSSTRTSTGTTLARGRGKIVSDIEKRIADFTFIPLEHGSSVSIVHYEVGQKFDPHFDYSTDKNYIAKLNGGQRVATLIMYLKDVEQGGETFFPCAKPNWNNSAAAGKKGLSVKPKMGDAMLFWSMKPDGSLDPASMHGGAAVTKGEKWLAIKWMHLNEYKV